MRPPNSATHPHPTNAEEPEPHYQGSGPPSLNYRWEPGAPTDTLPANYNAAVMRVKEVFAEEVERRRSERRHRQTHSPAQRYVLDELQRAFNAAEEGSSMRDKINALADTFRRPLSGAVQRQLRRIKQRNLGAKELVGELEHLYSKYALSDTSSRQIASEIDHQAP